MGDLRLATLMPFLLFPLLWILVSVAIGYMSGWHGLAATFRAGQPFEGERRHFQSASLRWGMSYNNCVTIGANVSGLYLALLLPFRAGHPPLFIRWDEVTVGPAKSFFFTRRCRLAFRSTPDVPLTVREDVADWLRARGGGAVRLAHL